MYAAAESLLNDIVRHLENSDRVAAAESMDDLVSWMNNTGHDPKIEFHTLEFLLSSYAEWLRK
jgi:hypothetical protein